MPRKGLSGWLWHSLCHEGAGRGCQEGSSVGIWPRNLYWLSKPLVLDSSLTCHALKMTLEDMRCVYFLCTFSQIHPTRKIWQESDIVLIVWKWHIDLWKCCIMIQWYSKPAVLQRRLREMGRALAILYTLLLLITTGGPK